MGGFAILGFVLGAHNRKRGSIIESLECGGTGYSPIRNNSERNRQRMSFGTGEQYTVTK